MARTLLSGLAQILGRVDFLAGRRLLYIADVRQVSGSWLIERFELVGEKARRLEPLELPRAAAARLPDGKRVSLEVPGSAPAIERLRPLHPLMMYEPQSEQVLFLCRPAERTQDRLPVLYDRFAHGARRFGGRAAGTVGPRAENAGRRCAGPPMGRQSRGGFAGPMRPKRAPAAATDRGRVSTPHQVGAGGDGRRLPGLATVAAAAGGAQSARGNGDQGGGPLQSGNPGAGPRRSSARRQGFHLRLRRRSVVLCHGARRRGPPVDDLRTARGAQDECRSRSISRHGTTRSARRAPSRA